MISPSEQFARDCAREIAALGADPAAADASGTWMNLVNAHKYSYHFSWLGRPVIQYPQDLLAMQEIVWRVKPDLILETGVAHGGGLVFYASLLELNAVCGGPENAKVLGLDIEIQPHNREAVEAHPLSRRIALLEGDSVDPAIVARAREFARPFRRVLVCLDSLHTHRHVLAELEAYAPLAAKDSYCVVFDTIIEKMPAGSFPDRLWDKGDNPMTAVAEFLKSHPEFAADRDLDDKLLISMAPGGYLRRVS